MNDLKVYEKIDFLLKELFITKIKYDQQYEKEEQFNVFEVLYKRHNEVKLHSRFLSTLLHPNASHKKGKVFLDAFLQLAFPKKEIDLGDPIHLQTFPNEQDKSEYKEIDILVINRVAKKALLIENKIHTKESVKDGVGQIQGYFNRIDKEDQIPEENIYTVYLTLDGRDPEHTQLAEVNDGVALSYDHHIKAWLDLCLKETVNQPFLRETIQQYKKLLLKMTNDQLDIAHRLAIRDIVSKNEDNFYAAKQLLDNFNHIKWHTVYDFWNEIEAELKDRQYKIIERPSEQNITDLTHYEVYRTGQRNKQICGIVFQVREGLNMRIEYNPDYWLYFGSQLSEIRSEAIKAKIELIASETSSNNTGNSWSFWKHFFEKEEDQIYLSSFSHKGTFDLIKADFRQSKIKQMMEELDGFIAQLNLAPKPEESNE